MTIFGEWVDETDWWTYAACRETDPAIFSKAPGVARFSERHWDEARVLCRRCPVAAQCLKDVLSLEPVDDEEITFEMFQAGLTPAELTKVYQRARGIK